MKPALRVAELVMVGCCSAYRGERPQSVHVMREAFSRWHSEQRQFDQLPVEQRQVHHRVRRQWDQLDPSVVARRSDWRFRVAAVVVAVVPADWPPVVPVVEQTVVAERFGDHLQ